MRKKINYLSLFIICITIAFSSCREREPDFFADLKGTYFSINQYALDEWSNHVSEVAAFERKETINGKTDSSYVNMEHLDWNSVVKTFLETDISDRKYLGKYKFSQFDDNTDNTHDFMYIAVNKDLFTQQLLITMDIHTNKVKGIYIETEKDNLWGTTRQKLYYAPMKTIQIQRFEKPLIGGKKDILIQYDVK